MNYSPKFYAKHAVLANLVMDELLERINWLAVTPRRILDAGTGTGRGAFLLKSRFKDASVTGLDIDANMLNYAKTQYTDINWHLADVCNMPIENNSQDLVFANFCLPWCLNITAALKDIQRVLTPNGVLFASFLGEGTIINSDSALYPQCYDIPSIVDAFASANLIEPVLERDLVTLTYDDRELAIEELLFSGLTENKLLLTKNTSLQFDYEIILTHAFKSTSEVFTKNLDGDVNIPLNFLKSKLTKS